MTRAMSTYVHVRQRLHPGLLDGLVRGGAEAIEIFAARDHLDYANRKQHVREIAQWFQSSGIPLNSVHSPLFSDYEWGRSGSAPVNIADLDRKRRIEAMDEIKRALEIAEQIPFNTYAPLPSRLGYGFCWRTFPTSFPRRRSWWNLSLKRILTTSGSALIWAMPTSRAV